MSYLQHSTVLISDSLLLSLLSPFLYQSFNCFDHWVSGVVIVKSIFMTIIQLFWTVTPRCCHYNVPFTTIKFVTVVRFGNWFIVVVPQLGPINFLSFFIFLLSVQLNLSSALVTHSIHNCISENYSDPTSILKNPHPIPFPAFNTSYEACGKVYRVQFHAAIGHRMLTLYV